MQIRVKEQNHQEQNSFPLKIGTCPKVRSSSKGKSRGTCAIRRSLVSTLECGTAACVPDPPALAKGREATAHVLKETGALFNIKQEGEEEQPNWGEEEEEEEESDEV